MRKNNRKKLNKVADTLFSDPRAVPNAPPQVHETIKIGDLEFGLPYSNLLPPYNDEKFDHLCEDVAVRGVLVPIITDEKKNVLDGEHRLKAAAKTKRKTIPFHIYPNLTNQEKEGLVIRLNCQRRHLDKDERLKLVVRLRKNGFSYREIGGMLDLSHETVRRYVEGTVTNVTVDLPDKIKGKDGKMRPAKGKSRHNPRPCIAVKNIGEAKKAFDACKLADPDKLPDTIIDSKRIARIGRETQARHRREQQYQDIKQGKVELLLGDFREKGKGIKSESVAMIFTDPPYAKSDLPLWNDLGELAARVLQPGGVLLSYSGTMYLPQVHEMLGSHLNYMWTFAIYHTGGDAFIASLNLKQRWKPVLAYYKPPLQKYWSPFVDMVSGGKSKDHHDWEQSVEEAVHYIKALCPINGTLLDPLMGSATTLVAGLSANLGLKCIGIEIDPAAFGTAQERIKKIL